MARGYSTPAIAAMLVATEATSRRTSATPKVTRGRRAALRLEQHVVSVYFGEARTGEVPRSQSARMRSSSEALVAGARRVRVAAGETSRGRVRRRGPHLAGQLGGRWPPRMHVLREPS
jgi:hypothetical protein